MCLSLVYFRGRPWIYSFPRLQVISQLVGIVPACLIREPCDVSALRYVQDSTAIESESEGKGNTEPTSHHQSAVSGIMEFGKEWSRVTMDIVIPPKTKERVCPG